MTRPKIVCLTPVKNEAWILDRFLKCASVWADIIIISDNGSSDKSRNIVKRYPKAILINNNYHLVNNQPDFTPAHDYYMRKSLFSYAKKITGKKLFMALDADEMFTANCLSSVEWTTMLKCKPGTLIQIGLINLLPGGNCWISSLFQNKGFVDDGTYYSLDPDKIWVVPHSDDNPVLRLNSIKILHYQCTDWERMLSKKRWYISVERSNSPQRSAIDIYRQYNSMLVSRRDIINVRREWFDEWEKKGIDMTSTNIDGSYWWDEEFFNLVQKKGRIFFTRDSVWDQNLNNNKSNIKDPRTPLRKLFHWWLFRTQPYSQTSVIKLTDSIIKRITTW